MTESKEEKEDNGEEVEVKVQRKLLKGDDDPKTLRAWLWSCAPKCHFYALLAVH